MIAAKLKDGDIFLFKKGVELKVKSLAAHYRDGDLKINVEWEDGEGAEYSADHEFGPNVVRR